MLIVPCLQQLGKRQKCCATRYVVLLPITCFTCRDFLLPVDNIRPQNTNPLANYPRATFQDLAIERGVYALVGASRDPNIGKFWENEKGTWDW